MPRTIVTSPTLAQLLGDQDGVVGVGQLLEHGFTPRTVNKRVERGSWQRLLPGVVLTRAGEPTRRQRLVAARLWGGADCAIDGIDALRWHGFDRPRVPNAPVHVVVGWDAPNRSRAFVVVRRSQAEIRIGGRGVVPYVDAATAAIVAARNETGPRNAIALLSRVLQTNLARESELAEARDRIGDKWCRKVDGALLAVGVGVRSPAEKDWHDLVITSNSLPPPKWNQWLDLGDGGGLVCVDALLEDAGLASEVIGKKYHAWGEQYDDTNARKERLQAAGLIVCEATATRIRRDGKRVLADLERTHARHVGRGMPPNVRLVAPPGIA